MDNIAGKKCLEDAEGFIVAPFRSLSRMILIKKITNALWRAYQSIWLVILYIYLVSVEYDNKFDKARQKLAIDALAFMLGLVAYWILVGFIIVYRE